jgi:hypothetical protein
MQKQQWAEAEKPFYCEMSNEKIKIKFSSIKLCADYDHKSSS